MSATTDPTTTISNTCQGWQDKTNWTKDKIPSYPDSGKYPCPTSSNKDEMCDFTIADICAFDTKCQYNPTDQSCKISCASRYPPKTCPTGQSALGTLGTTVDNFGCLPITYGECGVCNAKTTQDACTGEKGCVWDNKTNKCTNLQDETPINSSKLSVDSAISACKPLTNDQVKSKASDIAKAMGMDDKCKQEADTIAASYCQTAQASAPFIRGSESVSGTATASHMSSSGCGNIIAQMQDYETNTTSMACAMSGSTANSNVSIRSNQTINISTLPATTAELDAAVKLMQIASACTSPAAATLVDSATSIAKTITNRSTTITNSKITNTYVGNITATVTSDASTTSAVTAAFKAQVSSTAEQSLKQTLGVNSLPTNTKQLIDSHVKDNSQAISTAVSESISNNNASVGANQEINIKSAGAITITDSTISNDMVITMIAATASKAATGLGMQIATEIINTVQQGIDTGNKVAGLDDLTAALGKANSDAIKATAGSNNTLYMIIGGILLLVVLGSAGGYAYKNRDKFSSGGKGSMKLPSTSPMSLPKSVPGKKLAFLSGGEGDNSNMLTIVFIFVAFIIIVVGITLIVKK